MLMATVVVPHVFSPSNFLDPTYHLNLEVFLRGINSNGLILVDAEERLYEKICQEVELLATLGKGKTSHALFEELLKKRRQKIVRFVRTLCSFQVGRPEDEVASTIAVRCKPDALLVDVTREATAFCEAARTVKVISLNEYIQSAVENERRRYCEALPSMDQMADGEFERLIIAATKYSKWLRVYDKQIGKGTGLGRFRKGLSKLLRVWVDAAHFSKADLLVELFTVVDESSYRQQDPQVAYSRVKQDLVDSLAREFGIAVKLAFKRDVDAICHARHLQTQSVSILFERGFDFLADDGDFNRAFIKLDGASVAHLQEYRRLPTYEP